MTYIHIFLAEDDPDDRYFFEDAFKKAAIPGKVTVVEDGQKLTSLLAKVGSPPPPDIIFLDINMPRKNGKECLREIRDNDKFDGTPVVIFSTSNFHKDIDETFKDGASRYIMKNDFFENRQEMLKRLFSANWQQELLNPTKEQFIFRA